MGDFPPYTISDARLTLWDDGEGGTIYWNSPEIGFGEINFENSKGLVFETETLGREIIEKCLKYLLDHATIK